MFSQTFCRSFRDQLSALRSFFRSSANLPAFPSFKEILFVTVLKLRPNKVWKVHGYSIFEGRKVKPIHPPTSISQLICRAACFCACAKVEPTAPPMKSSIKTKRSFIFSSPPKSAGFLNIAAFTKAAKTCWNSHGLFLHPILTEAHAYKISYSSPVVGCLSLVDMAHFLQESNSKTKCLKAFHKSNF